MCFLNFVPTLFMAMCPATFLAACSDPGTSATVDIGGIVRPPGADGSVRDARAGDASGLHDVGPDTSDECLADDADGDGFGATGLCGPVDCDDTNAGIHPEAFEACNDIDEDCDGTADEGLNFSVCGVGACRIMMPNCSMGRPQRCEPAAPVAETCNAQDDDCDGAIDEEASQETCGVGACVRQASCADGGQCTPGAPAVEDCNNIDDDCDGVVDNGFRAGVVQTTYSELIGRHENCTGSGERIGPNCNAAMNRFCAAQPCVNTGFGPVENSGDTSVVTCVLSEGTERVTFATLATHHPDCNANPERIGPACNAAIHRYCVSEGHVSGFGPVESGGDFLWVACVGAGAQMVGTQYSVLTTHHGPCDGQGQRIGPDCNAAMHRFCRSQGFVSGFGPVENSGDNVAVVCLNP